MSESLRQQNQQLKTLNEDYATRYGFRDPVDYFHKGAKGLSHEVVEMISRMKNEPRWMADRRHEALDIYFSRVEEANSRFQESAQAGWLTDRGEVFITLGAPDEIFDSSSDLQDRGIRLIRWHYTGDRLTLDFVDESGFGRFRLTDRSRSDYLRVLSRLRRSE